MKVDTFAHRLGIAMNKKNINQVELSEKSIAYSVPISQSLINKYIKGKALARQDKIDVLSRILEVDPAWLMGYDVPMEGKKENKDDDFRYASYGGEDEELDEEDKEKIRAFVEFLKTQKKQKK